jgi:hypothetical protein
MGSSMAEARNRRPIVPEARVQSQVIPCGICCEKKGYSVRFFSSTSVFHVSIISLLPHAHSLIYHRRYIILAINKVADPGDRAV